MGSNKYDEVVYWLKCNKKNVVRVALTLLIVGTITCNIITGG